MSEISLHERLLQHRTVGAVSAMEIQWIANHGALRTLAPGDVLTPKGGVVEGLHLVLSGHLSIYVDRGTGPRKVMEWRGGDVTGLLPYSRLVGPPGDVAAEEPSELVTVYRSDLPQMTHDCPETTAILVHAMVDRARHFTSSFLHDEKLVSLGKLSAGLAHELNNPAAAIKRSARSLSAHLAAADGASRVIGSLQLSSQDWTAIEHLRDACLATAVGLSSPLQQERLEEEISDWLEAHKLDTSAAEELADIHLDRAQLDQLRRSLPREALAPALQWIAASATLRRMTSEIQEASGRIHHLVDAIKDFTQMDRSAVPEPVDVSHGLTSTLAILRTKAKEKSIATRLHLGKELPRVHGFAGELNQIWSNLIDNALDAAPGGGQVEVSANHEGGAVVVRVIDDGAGIPAEVRERIFDPFFTTKPVGKGTGLGLDIVRRLVQRHNGTIELDSAPGCTEFRVTLPVAPGSAH